MTPRSRANVKPTVAESDSAVAESPDGHGASSAKELDPKLDPTKP